VKLSQVYLANSAIIGFWAYTAGHMMLMRVLLLPVLLSRDHRPNRQITVMSDDTVTTADSQACKGEHSDRSMQLRSSLPDPVDLPTRTATGQSRPANASNLVSHHRSRRFFGQPMSQIWVTEP